jgi:diadenosine tetraphosphate (Ap4A) HIT family hydrolase
MSVGFEPGLLDEIRDMYRQGCVFCAPHPVLYLGGTEHFGLTADVAPLTAGHLVLHAREHVGCAGEVDAGLVPELVALRHAVRRMLTRRFAAVTFFEHGRAGSCLSDGPEHRLCHHMHIHAIPGEHDLTSQLDPRFDRLPIDRYEDIGDLYAVSGHYLHVESADGTMAFYPVSDSIERHLLRTCVARSILRLERADWQWHSEPALLADSVAALRAEVGALPRSVSGFQMASWPAVVFAARHDDR